MNLKVEQIKSIIDMKFLDTITEEQIVENYKGIRFLLRCLKDIYVISREDWKMLLDYAYEKYQGRLYQAITFRAAFKEMKEDEADI